MMLMDNLLKWMVGTNGNSLTIKMETWSLCSTWGNRIDILHDVGDRIVSFSDTPYVVDGRGFVIQRGEESFAYNTKGQLTKASRNGRYDVEYYYNTRGMIAVRKDNFGNLTQFFYSDLSKPDKVTHIYNNNDGKTTSFLYDDRGFLIFMVVNKEAYYIATDHNGSPLLVFDRKGGEVVKEVHRGPYGHVLFDSNPHFYLPIDFQAGILDPLTGMLHFGEMIYDSLAGQWLTPAGMKFFIMSLVLNICTSTASTRMTPLTSTRRIRTNWVTLIFEFLYFISFWKNLF
ncbi:teneurin-a [Caerostris extrusa]|uniref:Teneurin-a n=1 Tax=Caerostris extrusa TaxID=172846 RepID=A0AAV4RP72_CAEEX|nr:teneurin-a [Caerostris extrusa]